MSAATERAIDALSVPADERADVSASAGRFPDGAAIRIEIPHP
jgi:hypothetical protein